MTKEELLNTQTVSMKFGIGGYDVSASLEFRKSALKNALENFFTDEFTNDIVTNVAVAMAIQDLALFQPITYNMSNNDSIINVGTYNNINIWVDESMDFDDTRLIYILK